MATASELMGAGTAAGLAKMLGQDVETAVTAAGNNLATARALKASITLVSTAAASSGVRLPSANGQPLTAVYNGGANDLTVYPVSTSEFINAGAGGAGFTVPAGKTGLFLPAMNRWAALAGA